MTAPLCSWCREYPAVAPHGGCCSSACQADYRDACAAFGREMHRVGAISNATLFRHLTAARRHHLFEQELPNWIKTITLLILLAAIVVAVHRLGGRC